MLSDPLVLPHPDGNVSLVRNNQDGFTALYSLRTATSEIVCNVRHTKAKRPTNVPLGDVPERHNVELIETTWATATTPETQKKVYIVIEQLPSDLDVDLVRTLAGWLSASNGANALLLLQRNC